MITSVISLLYNKKNKLKNNDGETLIETLATMVILSLAVLIITGAIVTGAKVNHKTDNSATAFSTEGQQDKAGTITIRDNTSASKNTTLQVKVHTTQNDYTYYELQD